MFVQLLVSGLLTGAIYSLIALSMVLLLRSTTILNFAQGQLSTLGAFLVFALAFQRHWPYVVSLACALSAAFVVGWLLYKLIFHALAERPHLSQVLVTIGIGFVVEGVSQQLWGTMLHPVPAMVPVRPITLGEVVVTTQQIAILAVVAVVTGVFSWVFFGTRIGRVMQAATQSRRGALLVGIDVHRFQTAMWGVAATAAALAGALIGPLTGVAVGMGNDLLLDALAAMVLGGFGSLAGAALGGIFLGVISALGAGYVNSALQQILPLTLTLLVLLVRPTGLLKGMYHESHERIL